MEKLMDKKMENWMDKKIEAEDKMEKFDGSKDGMITKLHGSHSITYPG
jgi:hypothetical protein